MSFKTIVSYCIKCQRQGYYATRQQMLKNGASLADVHKMLAMRLRILGA